jgi:phosphoglycolate phosphatase-like HAD superfamily hydrolase
MRDVSTSLDMTEKKEKRLILFDIDSTLINSGGAGIAALKLASKKRFGDDEDLQGIEIAGRTDSGIARQILARHGIEPTTEQVWPFLDEYVALLAQQLPRCKGHVLPGIKSLLQWIEAQPHLTLGLLTGNIQGGAQLKLEHYELWKHFPFGAFADDHHDRNYLGAVACRRALEHTGWKFAPSFVDIIGDTEHDIACGKAIGARTVAVTTGSRSRERLAEAKPDFLFTDFENTSGVIATLGW